MNWNKYWDLSTIPDEKFFSEIQRRRASKVKTHHGSARSCGHTEWVMSCKCCFTNYKRTQYRIRKGVHPSLRREAKA